MLIYYITTLRVSDPVRNLQATAPHSREGRGARRNVQGFGLKLRARCTCKQWSEAPATVEGLSCNNMQHRRDHIVA